MAKTDLSSSVYNLAVVLDAFEVERFGYRVLDSGVVGVQKTSFGPLHDERALPNGPGTQNGHLALSKLSGHLNNRAEEKQREGRLKQA